MNYQNVPWEAAACKGIWTDLFFMENSAEATLITPQLRRICKGCPILEECREYAIEHERLGFWGGLTSRERGTMLAKSRRHNRAA